MPLVIRENLRTARKDHVCNFCGSKINSGQKYVDAFNVRDSEGFQWKTHRYCKELAITLKMYDDYEDGVSDDDFENHIIATYENYITLEKDPPFQQKLKEVCKYFGIQT